MRRLRLWVWSAVVLSLFGTCAEHPAFAQGKKPAASEKPEAAVLTSAILPEQWLKAGTVPLAKGEIDALVSAGLQKTKTRPSSLTSDEQFLRRAWLDLTGRLPMPADVDEFLADRDASKRAKVIDRLLESDEYAKHWSQYWRNVILSRLEDFRGRALQEHFDIWLAEQFKKNKSWGEITRAILMANGKVSFAEPDKNGEAFFLTSRVGADAITEIAGETSRIFLGVQIQCAQCHDHPSDVWKRQQFHEFAAYFARFRARPFREAGKLGGLQLTSIPFGEHQMPSKSDPKKGAIMQPRFLDGLSPGARLTDPERRQNLAGSITSPTNPWFAAAFVNRVWGELMGQAFYQPVDDLGTQKEAVMPEVITRLAGAFRGSDYNIKELFRAVMNSDAYQRQIRPGESTEEHLLFSAAYPRRLSADALWQTLEGALGKMAFPGQAQRRPAAGPFARLQGLEGLFKQEFNFDPSARPEDVEGSVAQALLLMNNPVINQKIRAQGTNLLARILKSYSQDNEALRVVYLRTLARRPSDRELNRCRDHIRTAGGRAEAYEDILWALVNSTEFQTRR